MNKKEGCSCSGSQIILPVIQEDSPCCPKAIEDQNIMPRLDQPFVTGSVPTIAGRIPTVAAELQPGDHWGTVKARWGVGRMDYMIDPGLYALGDPDNNSPVLVTANYKMSFDYLRRELPGRKAWILVLDTKGINVWCAAGKGTFGTEELIKRIEASGLKNIVSHRKVILPQLGAPGVAGHTVKKISGFKVYYGPIRAADLPAYLDSGWKTTPAMRIVTFPLKDRAVLIPIEGVYAVKPFLIIASILFILSGIGGPSGFWSNTINYGLFAVLALLTAIVSGAVLNPLLLPYLPGRAFSTKGFSIGLVAALILLYLRDINLQIWAGRAEALAWLLIIPAIAGYLAMNFTGASTYTSLSGVKKEMRWALPAQIAAGAGGLVIWIISRLIA
ncbi:MAG: mercury methylation corrinoid protein HgcA [Smithellaceae bacterium]